MAKVRIQKILESPEEIVLHTPGNITIDLPSSNWACPVTGQLIPVQS